MWVIKIVNFLILKMDDVAILIGKFYVFFSENGSTGVPKRVGYRGNKKSKFI